MERRGELRHRAQQRVETVATASDGQQHETVLTRGHGWAPHSL